MKRLFYHLLFFCLLAASAGAQEPVGTWGPVGNSPITNACYAAVANGSLYVLHYVENERGGILHRAISRWDGSSWELVTTFDYGGFYIYGFAAYRGELYVAGTSNSMQGIPGTDGIARWDGISWQPVGNGPGAELGLQSAQIFTNLVEFDGKLVCEVSSRGSQVLAQWDGSRWKRFDKPPGFDAQVLAAGRTRLYAGGWGGIFEWDGTRWKNISLSGVREVLAMGIYREEPCIVAGDVFLRHKGVWHAIAESQSSLIYPRLQLCEYDGRLFFSGKENGNGHRYAIEQWDGRQWSTYPASDGLIKVLIEYNGELYAGGNFKRIGSTPIAGMARLYTGKNSATISGTIFHDIDRNCVQSSGEEGIAGRVVEILPGPFYATTNEQGEYSCNLPPGDYTVTTTPVLYWNPSCNKDAHSVHLKNMGDIATGTDFPLVAEANVRDVRMSLASGRARPGFSIDYTVTYKNIGTVPVDGTVRFFHDPALTFESATPMYDRYSTGLAEWDFLDLPVGASRSIHVRLKIPQDMTLGSELCARAEIDLHDVYVFGIDLRDSTCVEVTGSFDPNDIQVTPYGGNKDGVLAETDSVLTYMIRFQNTGTDTAFKVVVVDTLAAGHAPASIRLGAASHPYSFTLSGSGVMTWTFENIMLPDSTVNEKESHGYLKYSIRLHRGLKPGTEIPNRANIYFDFNEPVITNTVVSTIPRKTGTGTAQPNELRRYMYPNPSYGSITIDAPAAKGSIIEVQDMLGQTVMRRTVTSTVELITLDLSPLPAGTYTVLVPLGDGAYITEKIALVR